MIVSTALMCMALNVYHEARGESVPGQYAVARVTQNRAEGDESKVCQVVFKRKQFSWANAGVARTAAGWSVSQALLPKDADAWAKAVRIAQVTLEGRMSSWVPNATHYHALYVAPAWKNSPKLKLTKVIGAHRFYAPAA